VAEAASLQVGTDICTVYVFHPLRTVFTHYARLGVKTQTLNPDP
jgi:hypothetical protein